MLGSTPPCTVHAPGKNRTAGTPLNTSTSTASGRRNFHAQLGLLDRVAIPELKLPYAIRLLHEYFQQRTGRAAFVCCHASKSRSPAIILAYLVGCGMSFKEALSLICTKHKMTDIHPAVLQSVAAYFGSQL